jgi:hypothetical protein
MATSNSAVTVSAATIASSLAQPVIVAIQQQIMASLPSGLAAAVLSHFAGGTAPAPTLQDASAPPARPMVDAILNDITSFLPSSLEQTAGRLGRLRPYDPPPCMGLTMSSGILSARARAVRARAAGADWDWPRCICAAARRTPLYPVGLL